MSIGVIIKRVAVGLALAGASLGLYGVAHADASVNSDSVTTVNSSSTSSIEVSSSHTTSTTVGQSSSDDSQGPSARESSSGTTSEASDSSSNSAQISSSNDGSAGPTDSNNTSDQSKLQAGLSLTAPSSEASEKPAEGSSVSVSASTALSQNLKTAQAKDQAQPVQSQVNSSGPIAPVADQSSQAPARNPQNAPVGALQAFSSTLAAIIVPAGHLFGRATGSLPENLPVVLITLSLLTAAAILGFSSRFVDRLRLSGFSHAARSDVSDIITFATRKMSFAWAVSPVQNSFLIDGSETKILKLTNAI